MLVLAGIDRRAKCVVSQVPTISGSEQVRRRVPPDAMSGYLQSLTDELRAMHQDRAPETQAVASADLPQPAAYRSREAIDFYLQEIGSAH